MQTGLCLPCTASGSAKRKKSRAQTSHLSTQNSTNITQTPKLALHVGWGCSCCAESNPSALPCSLGCAWHCFVQLYWLRFVLCPFRAFPVVSVMDRDISALKVNTGCIFQEYREELSPTSRFSLQVLSKLFPGPIGGKVFQLPKGEKL